MRALILAFAVMLPFVANSQVVNIERKRLNADTTGTFGNIKSSVSLIKNTKTLLNVFLSYNVLVVRNKHQWYFIGNLAFTKAENTDLVNNGYEHIRYNYRLTKGYRLYAEAFEQVQFDAIRKIDKRILAGGGIRYAPVRNKKFLAIVGVGSMYEFEIFINDTTGFNWIRLNSYVSLNYKITKNLYFYSTSYYQPLPKEIKGNYRLFNDTGFSMRVSNHFSFTVDYEIVYDSFLPKDVPNTVYFLKNGLSYKF